MTANWIWQQQGWPHFCWQDEPATTTATSSTTQRNAILAIEAERLNAQSVHSSLARLIALSQEGVSEEQPYPISDRSEVLATMMLDAIDNRHQPLTLERLQQWHQWLFPATDWTVQRVCISQLRGVIQLHGIS